MKVKFLFILVIVFSSNLFAQQLITEFNTTHTTSESGSLKMGVKWSLFDTHLRMSYTDKNYIKTMKQIGQEAFIDIDLPYKLLKEVNDFSVWYFYQDDTIQIKVVIEGIPKPSVTIKSKKDDFTGTLGTTIGYFSLLD